MPAAAPVTPDQIYASMSAMIKANSAIINSMGDLKDALIDSKDKRRQEKVNQEVAETAKKLGVSFKKTSEGLQKALEEINDYTLATKSLNKAMEKAEDGTTELDAAFKMTVKNYLKTAKEQNKMPAAVKQNLKTLEDFANGVESNAMEDIHVLAILRGSQEDLAKEEAKYAAELKDLQKRVKNINMKEALNDALERQGGIAGAIGGMWRTGEASKFFNYTKAAFADMMISGLKMATAQFIDQYRMFAKTGVGPLNIAAGKLLINAGDLQNIMQENKSSVLAMQGGTTAYTGALSELSDQTMKATGLDRVNSAKLAAASLKLQQQLAGTALTDKELIKRSKTYLTGLTALGDTINMTPEAIHEFNQGLMEDNSFRESLLRMQDKERSTIIETIDARAKELGVIGIVGKRALDLAATFEKAQKNTTPMSRFKSAQYLALYAAQVGMEQKKRERLTYLKQQGELQGPEKKEMTNLLIELNQLGTKRFAEENKNNSANADLLERQRQIYLEHSTAEEKQLEEQLRSGAVTAPGQKASNAGKQTGVLKGDFQSNILKDTAEIATKLQNILDFISGNGLMKLLIGVGGFVVTQFLLKGLGSLLGNLLKGVLGGAAGKGALGDAADVAGDLAKGGKGGLLGKAAKVAKVAAKGAVLLDAAFGVLDEAQNGPKTLSNIDATDIISPMSWGRLAGHYINEGVEAATGGNSIGGMIADVFQGDTNATSTTYMPARKRQGVPGTPTANAPAPPSSADALGGYGQGTADAQVQLLKMTKEHQEGIEQNTAELLEIEKEKMRRAALPRNNDNRKLQQ